MQVSAGDNVTLASLLKAGLADHEAALQDISDAASREYSLEKLLDRMEVRMAVHDMFMTEVAH